MGQVFDAISAREVELWDHQTVKLAHNLGQREDLFSDEALAELIENIDPAQLDITTMGDGVTSWSHVDRAGQPGAAVIDAVRGGRVWINMMALERADSRYARLLADMYGELTDALPGFDTFKRRLGLLISSPRARVFYHIDVPGQALWQIRGSKRIWIYPPCEPFRRPNEVENVIRSVSMDHLGYQPWFDDYAEVRDLGPGDMLHWALNAPHRVDNLDGLSVSLTTEHWTPRIRRSYALHYGNGILRDQLGWTPRSQSLDGPAFWAKAALTAAWRASGQATKLERERGYKRVLTHRIDPHAPLGVRPIYETNHVRAAT